MEKVHTLNNSEKGVVYTLYFLLSLCKERLRVSDIRDKEQLPKFSLCTALGNTTQASVWEGNDRHQSA